ncbi:hypothetical protein A1F99_049330 [Pyrenophora tritici-repentis]|nr:hypothetical protein A1F99_049330 [Pyrenophora tritici-repentis]
MKGLVTPASLDLFDFVYENPIQQMRSPGLNREDDLSRVVAQGTPRYFDASLFGESHLATGSGKGPGSCMQNSILTRQILQSAPGSSDNPSAFENSLNLAARRNSEVDSHNVTRNASQQGPLPFSLPALGWQVFLEPLQKLFKNQEGNLNTFIKAQHVIQIHRALLNPQKRSVQPTELYLLLVTITWGALLDTEVNTPVKADLADAVEDMTKLLFRHADSVDKLLALVAMLCLAEKMNQKELHALILGCAGTASSLKLQMRSVVHATCLSEEQAAQVGQAIRVLYCIDKSYALRWQTLPKRYRGIG